MFLSFFRAKPAKNLDESERLLIELSSAHSSELHVSQPIVLEQMKKERDLFIASTKLTNIYISTLNKNENWHDDSGPAKLEFALERSRLCLLQKELEENHLLEDSLDPLFLKIEEKTQETSHVLKKYYIEENNVAQYKVEVQAIERQAVELFCHLFSHPSEELQDHLSSLCSLNASYLLRALCKKYPSQVDLTSLLSIAMRNLNFEAVKVLVALGADVNKTVLLYQDHDSDVKVSGPILVYPFLALLSGASEVFLAQVQTDSELFFRIDHPKLLCIMSYLVNSGANAEQKIKFERYRTTIDKGGAELMLSDDNWHREISIKQFAQELLEGGEFITMCTPEFEELLKNLANWTPDSILQCQPPNSEELQAYINFVERQIQEAELDEKTSLRP